MIKNVIFDIGNVILNFNLLSVLPAFTDNKDEQNFILDNIINTSKQNFEMRLIDCEYRLKKEREED